MRMVSIAALAVLLAAAPTRAEEAAPNAPPSHGWGLQFGINQLGGVDTFDGFTISGRRQASASGSWRFGLGLDLNNRTSDRDETNQSSYGPPYPIVGDLHESNNLIELGLTRVTTPTPEAMIDVGDVLIAAGTTDELRALEEIFAPRETLAG